MAATTRNLPTTRLALRRSAGRGWLLGVGLTIGVNVLVVLGLSQASKLVDRHQEPPVPVRAIQRVETPPPPHEAPPPPPEPAQAPDPEIPTVALPALALAEGPASGALELPALTSGEMILTLPTQVPAFVAIAPEAPATGIGGDLGGAGLVFDEAPVLVSEFDLRRFYPRPAVSRGIEGETVLRLVIDSSGAVTDVTVVSSRPEGVFEEAALRLAQRFRFRAARRGGEAVPAIFTQTIAWRLN